MIGSPQERKTPTGPRSIGEGHRGPALVLDSSGAPWMGPGEPSHSVIPPGNDPRSWQYPMWWNVGEPRSVKSRESGGIGFDDFRALSNQVHVRAAIESVKNAQCKKEWVFTVKPIPGERSTDAAMRAQNDPRIREIADFFETPDGEHDLAEWLRMFLEDVLVIDAPAVYCARRNNGKPFELEIFDGATIRPLIDATGRRPRHPEAAFQQYLYGQPGDKFTRDEMMYAPRNPRSGKAMGFSPVEQLCLYINIALRKDLQRLHTYTEGNIPAGLLPMPPDFKGPDIATWYASFNAFVKGIPENLVKLIPIPGGTGQPIFPSLEANKDMWEESWIRLVCFAFDVSVASLVKEMNRATAEVGRDSAEQDGAAAYTDYVRRRLNWIIRNWFGYADIIARPKQELDVEAETQARIDESELRVGTLQVNEKREREGRSPIMALEGLEGYFGPGGWVQFGAIAQQAGTEGFSPDPEASLPAVNDEATAAAAAVANIQLNGAQIAAATGIIASVAKGDIPRDSGISQLETFFSLTKIQAEALMGSAGNPKVPTTPNPRPQAEQNSVAAPAAPPVDGDAEKAQGPFEYSSTEVVLPAGAGDKVKALAAMIPDEALHEKGREDHPHVTLKYGILDSVTADEVGLLLVSEAPGTLTLGRTAFFSADEYDVVYVAVESPDLFRLNALVRDGVETIDTQPKYVPHATLAYVQSGRGAEFAGESVLSGTVIRFDSILFRHANGTAAVLPLGGESAKASKKKDSLSRVPTSFVNARAY